MVNTYLVWWRRRWNGEQPVGTVKSQASRALARLGVDAALIPDPLEVSR